MLLIHHKQLYNNQQNSGIVCGNYNGGVISSTYGYGYVNGISANKMYGSSSDFGNWTYNAALNDGYPVQKTLFHIGGISGSENVYNYLLNKLNLILDMDKYMAWENEQLAAHSKTQHFITKDANGVYATVNYITIRISSNAARIKTI